MNDGRPLPADAAAELRLAFDRSFAEARSPDPPPSEDLLAIRIEAEPYALRLSEIAGVFADRKITRLPTSVPALLGVAGFRGAMLPVWDLHGLLGHSPVETLRWLVIASATPVALGFAAMDGHIRVPREALVPRKEGDTERGHVREFVHAPQLVRPIVSLASVLAAISTTIGERARDNIKTGER